MKTNPAPRRGAIDWAKVRDRLKRAIQATEEALALSPERARKIMEERARVLARVPDRGAAMDVLLVVVFTLGNERYAIETRFTREVIRLTELTPLPETPVYFLGVTNLRGHILAVVDLRQLFSLAAGQHSDGRRILVLGGERAEVGALVDDASEVTRLPREDILDPPGATGGVGREYVRGVTVDGLIVLDGAALLEDPRLFIDQEEEPGL